MQISYTKGWFRAHKRALQAYSPEQAQALDAAGTGYTAIAGPLEKPFAFLEIGPANGFIGVCFLDGELRTDLEYTFKRQPSGNYFLMSALFRAFVDDTGDKVRLAEDWRFTPDGQVYHTIYDMEKNLRHSEEMAEPDYFLELWEPAPAGFGQLEGFLKRERGRKPA